MAVIVAYLDSIIDEKCIDGNRNFKFTSEYNYRRQVRRRERGGEVLDTLVFIYTFNRG